MTVTHEFYSPFAHIPGRYELARIHSPTHGSFDVWIVIETTTDRPVTVYVNSDNGERFMAERYPESTTIRVEEENLSIESDQWQREIRGFLIAQDGPLRTGTLRFTRTGTAPPVATAYGGSDFPVWGSRYSCEGVDLETKAVVTGTLITPDGPVTFSGHPGIITLGSYGAITPGD